MYFKNKEFYVTKKYNFIYYMAHNKCFQNLSDNLNSGDYISRKKAKSLYKSGVNLAKQPIPGIYQKKTSLGQNKGIYTDDFFIGSNKCLVGAKNYETLLSVTQGKYLVDPINFDIRRNQSLQIGNLYVMDFSGVETIAQHPYWPDPSTNTFNYPPSPDSNQIYPTDNSNNTIGPVMDYSYNVFYPQGLTQSSRGSCYLKNERSYKQYLKCLHRHLG